MTKLLLLSGLAIAVLTLAAALWFGWESLAAFALAMPAAVDGYLRHDRLTRVVAWGDLESVYGLLRALGAGGPAAWGVHLAIALTATAASLALARRRVPAPLQMAALATAMFLATPYSELNDAAILMVPCAFLLRDGLMRGLGAAEKAVLAVIFLMPLFYLPGRALAKELWFPELAGWAGLAPAMAALLCVLIVCRAARSPR